MVGLLSHGLVSLRGRIGEASLCVQGTLCFIDVKDKHKHFWEGPKQNQRGCISKQGRGGLQTTDYSAETKPCFFLSVFFFFLNE